MIEWTAKTFIGFGMGALCTVSLTVCLFTWIAVYNLAIVQKKSPVYIISLANISSDIVWICMYFIFLVPSIILDDLYLLSGSFALSRIVNRGGCKLFDRITHIRYTGWIWPGKRGELFSNVIGFIINNCWYGTSFLQILMAINRLVVICFSKSNIFTFRLLRVLAPFLLIPCATIHTWIQQELLPCCRMSLDPSRLGYGFELIPNVTNYSNTYLAFPTNLITSTTSILCYLIIYIYVRHQTAALKTVAKRRNDLIYAVQFCAISLFHLFAWTSVRFLPTIITNNIQTGVENWFSVSAFMIICDASANSFVYLAFNVEVRAVFRREHWLSPERGNSIQVVSIATSQG